MKINVFNNNNIKLQGLCYYNDSYKYWDLNHCKHAFENDYFNLLPQINGKFHNHTLLMATISLDDYSHKFSIYRNSLSSKIKRDIEISKKNKFYFKKLNFNHHIYDFLDINHSQNKYRKINPWYVQPPEIFLNSHSGYIHEWEDDSHYSQWYGLFKYFKHYKQAEITTNEKMFAYCKLVVEGELATIHLIWGHRNFLNKGIMFHLITNIVEEIMKDERLKCLVYYAWNQYPKWKSRMLFKPKKIEIIL
tara:strand:- start:217 stop:960 length:744 start_codon:yes stop_codon:yes gene_type:complete